MILTLIAAGMLVGPAMSAADVVPAKLTAAERKDLSVQADQHEAQGKLLQAKYRERTAGNSAVLIDAAVEFFTAHKLFQQLGDLDGVVRTQAEKFWCTKQMTGNALQAFNVRVGISQPVEEPAPAPVAPVVPPPATVTEAPPPPKPVPVILGRMVKPDERTIKAAFAAVRNDFAKELNRRTFAAKRALARRFIEEAAKPAIDPARRYALLQEAGRLAQESEDYVTIGDAGTRLDAAFTGFDGQDYFRSALRQMKDKPIAQALLALIADPNDALANLAVGRYYCFELDRWEAGLALMAKGSDPDLKWLATEEASRPTDEAHRIRLGDAWYDQAKRAGSPEERNAMFERTQFWYRQVVRTMEGPGKRRLEQRLTEIDKVLPVDPDTLDWQNITPGQWEKLRFPVVVVEAKEAQVDAKRALKAGEKVRLVAHPEDRWTFQGADFGTVTTDWRGVPIASVKGGGGLTGEAASLGFGAVVCRIDGKRPQPIGQVLTGPLPLVVASNRAQVATATGSIRVKLVAINDD